MNFYTVFLLSQIAIFPFILSIVKFKYSTEIIKLNIYFIISYIVECIISLLIKVKIYDYTTIIGNVFILLSFILLITFFIHKKSKVKYLIILTFTMLWFIDNKILHSLNERNSFSRILFNIIIFILCIRLFYNLIMMRSNKTNIKSLLIFASGFIIDSIFRINFETIYYFKKDITINLDKALFSILVFSNALANILFTYAYICFKKQKRIQSYIS
jgi:hypothetical protein